MNTTQQKINEVQAEHDEFVSQAREQEKLSYNKWRMANIRKDIDRTARRLKRLEEIQAKEVEN